MINFGALIAFTVVNLTVLLYFAVHLKKRNTPTEILTNIVLPVIGMCLTAVLWINLHFDALLYGAIWFVVGLILLVYVTRGLRTAADDEDRRGDPGRGGHPDPARRAPQEGRGPVKLLVGYLATPGGADAVALGVRLARTLGADLELRMVLAPDDVTTPRVTSDKFHDVLAEQRFGVARRGTAAGARRRHGQRRGPRRRFGGRGTQRRSAPARCRGHRGRRIRRRPGRELGARLVRRRPAALRAGPGRGGAARYPRLRR